MSKRRPPRRSTKLVHLRPAHAWDCPRCRRVNYAQGVPVELTESEAAEARAKAGVADADGEVGWLSGPTEVTCGGCRFIFAVCAEDSVPSVGELRRMLGGEAGSDV